MSFAEQLAEEQAERQRRRAPEPGPAETVVVVDYGAKTRTVQWVLWVIVGVFALLALTLRPWVFEAFWIGMPISCGIAAAYLEISRR
jgi:hypothetical protein